MSIRVEEEVALGVLQLANGSSGLLAHDPDAVRLVSVRHCLLHIDELVRRHRIFRGIMEIEAQYVLKQED